MRKGSRYFRAVRPAAPPPGHPRARQARQAPKKYQRDSCVLACTNELPQTRPVNGHARSARHTPKGELGAQAHGAEPNRHLVTTRPLNQHDATSWWHAHALLQPLHKNIRKAYHSSKAAVTTQCLQCFQTPLNPYKLSTALTSAIGPGQAMPRTTDSKEHKASRKA